MSPVLREEKERIVISLGGSLVVPASGIDIDFLKRFNSFIRVKLSQDHNLQFFIVVGGGITTRHYQHAAREVLEQEVAPEDLDWIGVHATRLNAHLLRTIFRDIAHPVILDRYDIIRKVEEPVVIASGWRPGWSTDFCAVMVCDDYNVNTVLNLSNIEMAYDKDPKTNADAKPIKETTWQEFRKLVGNEWIPGMNVPFDPVAARRAEEIGLRTIILKGSNFENMENYFDGKDFIGTTINPAI